MKRKLLSVVLAFFMTVSILPTPVFASGNDARQILEQITYIGDRSKCALTAEQAAGYAEAVKGLPKAEKVCAVLIDVADDGVPVLFLSALINFSDFEGEDYCMELWGISDGHVKEYEEIPYGYLSLVSTDNRQYIVSSNFLGDGATHVYYYIERGKITPVLYHANSSGDLDYTLAYVKYDNIIDNDEWVLSGTYDNASSRWVLSENGSSYELLPSETFDDDKPDGSSVTYKSNVSLLESLEPKDLLNSETIMYLFEEDCVSGIPNSDLPRVTYDTAVRLFQSYADALAAVLIATPTPSKVTVNGKDVEFDAYNIKDSNYFKLRDLAYILNGTEKQFEVGWDGANNAISIISGKAYMAAGGEMTGKGSGNKTPSPTSSKIYLDGKEITFTAYNIDGNNYFKLRDMGQAFDFSVDWDGANNAIIIDTGKGYASN